VKADDEREREASALDYTKEHSLCLVSKSGAEKISVMNRLFPPPSHIFLPPPAPLPLHLSLRDDEHAVCFLLVVRDDSPGGEVAGLALQEQLNHSLLLKMLLRLWCGQTWVWGHDNFIGHWAR
jgi:hypothetical protein